MSSDSRFDYLLRAAELTGSTLSKEQYIDFQSQELDEEQSEALSKNRSRAVLLRRTPESDPLSLTLSCSCPDSPQAPTDLSFSAEGSWYMQLQAGAVADITLNPSEFLELVQRSIVMAIFREKHSNGGQHDYQCLGLGVVGSYDSQHRLYILEGLSEDGIGRLLGRVPNPAQAACLHLQMCCTRRLGSSSMFGDDGQIDSNYRECAFQRVLLEEYNFTCAFSGRRVQFGNLAESLASVIKPIPDGGVLDFRNAIVLCPNFDWAFRSGLLAINADCRLKVSDLIKQHERSAPEYAELDGKEMHMPKSSFRSPSSEMLSWHRENVFVQHSA